MNSAAAIDDQPLRPPAARFSAEREIDPLTGIDWLNDEAIFARPWPTSSWFSSQRVWVLRAIAYEPVATSMKLTNDSMKAAGSSDRLTDHSIEGTENCGRPRGISPTTLPPFAP